MNHVNLDAIREKLTLYRRAGVGEAMTHAFALAADAANLVGEIEKLRCEKELAKKHGEILMEAIRRIITTHERGWRIEERGAALQQAVDAYSTVQACNAREDS
jgi:hypothetical protein